MGTMIPVYSISYIDASALIRAIKSAIGESEHCPCCDTSSPSSESSSGSPSSGHRDTSSPSSQSGSSSSSSSSSSSGSYFAPCDQIYVDLVSEYGYEYHGTLCLIETQENPDFHHYWPCTSEQTGFWISMSVPAAGHGTSFLVLHTPEGYTYEVAFEFGGFPIDVSSHSGATGLYWLRADCFSASSSSAASSAAASSGRQSSWSSGHGGESGESSSRDSGSSSSPHSDACRTIYAEISGMKWDLPHDYSGQFVLSRTTPAGDAETSEYIPEQTGSGIWKMEIERHPDGNIAAYVYMSSGGGVYEAYGNGDFPMHLESSSFSAYHLTIDISCLDDDMFLVDPFWPR